MKELKAQDIMDKYDLIYKNYQDEKAEKGIYIDFLDGYFRVEKLPKDELAKYIQEIIKDQVKGAE